MGRRATVRGIIQAVVGAAVGLGVTARAVTVNDFQAFWYTNAPSQVLPYRLFVPATQPGQKYPLVIFLHGAGQRGTDNHVQVEEPLTALVFCEPHNQSRWPCFFVAPQCPSGLTWAGLNAGDNWGDPDGTGDFTAQPTWPLAAMMNLLGYLTNNSPYAAQIDTSRIHITGLSMGGYGTFEALCRWPTAFTNGAAVCGGGDPLQAGSMASKPLWAFHAADDPVVPAARSRQMIQALRNLGGAPRYTEYPSNMGFSHGSWDPAYADPELLPWMFGPALPGTNGGDGVFARYYDDKTFVSAPKLLQVEAAINHNWENRVPGAGIPADNFGARFTAKLQPPTSDTYTFTASVDDHVSVWIDGQLVINAGYLDPKSTNVFLSSAALHDLRVDYVEDGGQAWVNLTWASSTMSARSILPDFLLNNAPRAAQPTFYANAGAYSGSVAVSMSCTTAGAVIHFTTNGVAPDTDMPVYAGPVTVSTSMMVRAVAVVTGMANSAVMTADYVIGNGAPVNLPPLVSAGTNQTIVLPSPASLIGSVTDDGRPAPPGAVTTTWSKINGPGTVNFANATTNITTATFAQPGAYVLRLTGSDSALNASNDVAITVADSFVAWQSRHSVSGATADPDGDGLANLLEYAFNLNPNIATIAGVPAVAQENDHHTLTYTRRKLPTDVTYTVLASDNVASGFSNGGITEQVLADDGFFQTVKATDSAAISTKSSRFIRLQVSQP